jgi:archaemetzincin
MRRVDLRKKAAIGIVPIGDGADMAAKVIAAHLSGYLDLDADIRVPLTLPSRAWDRGRLQVDAGKLIAALEAEPYSDDYAKLVGVMNADMGMPIFTHVLGEAQQGGQWAVVSLFRLHPPAENRSPGMIYERVAKIALHEIGHLFNLRHCDGPGCLMQFSGGLDELDRLSLHFCRYCRAYFEEALDAGGLRTSRTG